MYVGMKHHMVNWSKMYAITHAVVCPRPSALCFNETALFIALTFCSLKNFVPFVYPCSVDHCVSSAVVVFFSLYSAQILVKPELYHVQVSREFYGEKNMKKKQVKYF